MGKKLTYEEVKNYIEEHGNGDFLVSETYENHESLLELECHSCKQHYFKTFKQFQSYNKHPNCPNKPKKKSKTKHSYEYVFDHIASKGGKLLSKTYIDNATKLNISCSCGNIISRPFASIANSYRILCDECQNKAQSEERRISFEEVKTSLLDAGYLLLDNEYVNTEEKINVESIYTKYRYSAKRNQILKYKLLEFAPNNPYAEHNFRIWMQNNKIENCAFINIFIKNKNTYGNFKCNVCGEIWDMLLSVILHKNQNCPYCANKRVGKINNLLKNYPSVCKDWDYSKNELLPSEIVSRSNKKVWWKCHKCGYEWEASPNTRTGKTKSGCYHCAKSKGEKIISQYLKDNNIFFDCQHWFDDCRNKKPLKFDFGIFSDLEKKNLIGLIEYDGELHFFPYRSHKDNYDKLKSIQKNDEIKNNYCEKNNIYLLRIPFWDKEYINDILNRSIFFNLRKEDILIG